NGGCILEKLSIGLNMDDEQPICIVEIIKSALKERILEKNIRRILSDILYRHSLSPSACFRSLPLWYYMLKK
ncbi:MAG: hypothetical protein L6408_04685, partial [Nanoarchaeota archaeon]|nr:hypothetical protein [Nanoarchaeota archaeon]